MKIDLDLQRSLATFLLIDDAPSESSSIKREFLLLPFPVQLQSASNTSEAMDYICGNFKDARSSGRPVPDIILICLDGLKLEGFEFLRWLKSTTTEELRRIPVVVLASSAAVSEVRQAYALGANAYMQKPKGKAELTRFILGLATYWAGQVVTAEPILKETASVG